jgi:hypothetical protein
MTPVILSLFWVWLLKFIQPQTARFDMEIIYAIFEGPVITISFGKLRALSVRLREMIKACSGSLL